MAFEELYQEIILDHYRHPRGAARLDDVPDEQVHENPSCGDSLKLEVRRRDGTVESVRFDGRGCAISMASASMMSERLSGRSVEEARALAGAFLRVMRGEEPPERLEEWGDLAALGGVVRFPLRVKCATLAWHALQKALDRAG